MNVLERPSSLGEGLRRVKELFDISGNNCSEKLGERLYMSKDGKTLSIVGHSDKLVINKKNPLLEDIVERNIKLNGNNPILKNIGKFVCLEKNYKRSVLDNKIILLDKSYNVVKYSFLKDSDMNKIGLAKVKDHYSCIKKIKNSGIKI